MISRKLYDLADELMASLAMDSFDNEKIKGKSKIIRTSNILFRMARKLERMGY